MRLGATIHRPARAVILFFSSALGALPLPAVALPIWAHQYDVTCQKCHTEIPRLTPFGAHFAASGYRMIGVEPDSAVPVSVKINLVASSERQGDGDDGAGLPKAIVDEVEFLAGGTIGARGNYFIEQYVVDGGQVGNLRESWLNLRLDPWTNRVPVYVQSGSQTLPLPVDPETFRETYQGYAVFDQTVGANPFNFFDPKAGTKLSVGDTSRGANVQVFAEPGHDVQSGLQTAGTDLMGYAQQVLGPVTFSAYRYQGTRQLKPLGLDRFVRTGFGAVFVDRKWEYDSVIQTGFDSNLSRAGVASSGGFAQVRYAFGPRLFALARYEGTSDGTGAFSRDGVLLLGYRPDHVSRITIEEVVTHAPQTRNTMNFQYTVAH